jgi:hypothetical protein
MDGVPIGSAFRVVRMVLSMPYWVMAHRECDG